MYGVTSWEDVKGGMAFTDFKRITVLACIRWNSAYVAAPWFDFVLNSVFSAKRAILYRLAYAILIDICHIIFGSISRVRTLPILACWEDLFQVCIG